ncbi:hypothetical protein D3C80_864530 [compost metagenome]
MTQSETTEAVLKPGGQVVVFAQWQPGTGTQLPRGCSVIGVCRRQRTPALGRFAPGLPETVAIRKAVQAAAAIEARLLQRLRRALVAGYAARFAPAPVIHTLATQQAGSGPGLFGAAPLDPCQA